MPLTSPSLLTSPTLLTGEAGAGASFIGATTASTNGGQSLALNTHASALVGDILCAIISHRGTGIISGPAGWNAAAHLATTELAQTCVLENRVVARSRDAVSGPSALSQGGEQRPIRRFR